MGTSRPWQKRVQQPPDHPHAYGDKTWSANTIFGIVGSSPRVWGQENINLDMDDVQRIIPTRMGTRKHILTLVNGNKDHPHAYGDKYAGDGVFTMWERIIPTHMGTRCWWEVLSNTGKDHPHAYGDKISGHFIRQGVKGSSPRVWGQGR